MTELSLETPFASVVLASVDSTNAEARRRADAGIQGPLWITAREQTAGRGRRGRTWESRAGDLTATLLLTLDVAAQEAACLSFAAALAVGDLAAEVCGRGSVALKWPNDVLVAGRKAAGILIESGQAAPGWLWLAIGLGVNLVSAPEGLERPATSFAAQLSGPGAVPSPEAALVRLDAHVRRRLADWREGGRARILSDWIKLAAGVPGPCAARLPDGELRGHAEGLDPDGALRLRLQDGSLRRITAGEVFFGADAAGAS